MEILLDFLEQQIELDRTKGLTSWKPRDLGITVLQTYVDAPELKLGIWHVSHSVGRHFDEHKIISLLPERLPTSHSNWAFFMSGPGDVTNPHIDPPITRTIFWQIIGYKIWGIWPPTTENLAAFEHTAPADRTWGWAIEKLSEAGRKIILMEPGTWWELNQFEIHACISLTPSAHATQEFFYAGDSVQILNVWKSTEKAREKATNVTTFEVQGLKPHAIWLPKIFADQSSLEPMVEHSIRLYEYAREMVIAGKSDQITDISEVRVMLPLVRLWIEKYALLQE